MSEILSIPIDQSKHCGIYQNHLHEAFLKAARMYSVAESKRKCYKFTLHFVYFLGTWYSWPPKLISANMSLSLNCEISILQILSVLH